MKHSLKREFTRYITLGVLGTLGVSCYILADTFFISMGLGTNGLAALNLAIPVYNFIHGTGIMLGIGAATRFSVLKSQDREKDSNRVFTNAVYLALAFSVVFLIIGLLFSNKLAVILGADDYVLQMTDTYLKWLLIFAPAFIFNDLFLCFVRNDGSPRLAMTAMLIGSFSNILLDYIFIFPLNMGIFGAVFATGISPVISMLIMSQHRIKRKNGFRLVKTKLKPYIIKRILALGFPSLIAQISSATVMIVFNIIILNLEGNTGVAAYGVIANISLVVMAVFEGIAQGAQPLISSFYGKGNMSKARKVLKYSLFTMLSVAVAVYLLVFVFANPITSIFNSENSKMLQIIAVNGLKLYFISCPFAGFNIISAIFFTSVEKPLPAHALSILRGIVIIIPSAFLMSYLWQMNGVWLAFPLTEIIVAVIGVIVYVKCKKAC